MHAVRFNHLRHHRHCLGASDLEATSARMSAAGAVLFGPAFPILLHAAALRGASSRERGWILSELAANAVWLVLVLGVFESSALRYHAAAMTVGQCLTAFFAVWTVHRGCEPKHFIARTLRGRVVCALTMNMFFHIEHHLFPQVPTCRLPELARRLDAVAPELREMRVFGARLGASGTPS